MIRVRQLVEYGQTHDVEAVTTTGQLAIETQADDSTASVIQRLSQIPTPAATTAVRIRNSYV